MLRRVAGSIVVLAVLSACLASQAMAAVPGMPPSGKVLLGVGGVALNPVQFSRLTHKRHSIHVVSFGWGQGISWGGSLDDWLAKTRSGNYRLMFHITTTDARGHERITPGGIARGSGDGYLLAAARKFNDSGQVVYVRPMAEMNGHWNVWSAFNANGTARNAAHSTLQFRHAFMRISLIMRGGNVASINSTLRFNHMPVLRTGQSVLPRSGHVAIVWNPQSEGSPNIKANMPRAYYPGKNFVDYVANDMYSIGGHAAWRQQEAMYRDFATKPFMEAEWAPWGTDEPSFIKAMFNWTATHHRVAALIYFNGTKRGVFTLSLKPRSLAAYRQLVTAHRYDCPLVCGTMP